MGGLCWEPLAHNDPRAIEAICNLHGQWLKE
jgi:hypothetical protein